MPMQPFIFVGVGGTGGKTLGVIRKTLADTLQWIGWDESWPKGWQFVHIDVPADPDNKSTGDDPFSLPRTSYVPLTKVTSTYVQFDEAIRASVTSAVSDRYERYLAWDSWRPDPAHQVPVEISNGAGQFRTIGRVCVLRSLKLVDDALKRAYDTATSATSVPQLQRIQELIGKEPLTPGEVKPIIFVVGSVSGGSGSGMVLDVIDVLRAHRHRHINTILFSPEVFQRADGSTDPGVAPNSFMALNEIANSMWTSGAADAPISRDRMFSQAGVRYPVGQGGPSTVFLVGRKNRAVSFDTADEVYKIVGRSLGELVVDEGLTTDIVNYDIANGKAVAAGRQDLLGLSVPGEKRDSACFRGLGFSRLTVGRDVFDRYATDRLQRSVILRLLDGHLERRRPNDASSDDELKQLVVTEAWPGFLRDSKLDEVGNSNGISEPINTWNRPELSGPRRDFTASLRADIETSAERGKVKAAEARAIAVDMVRRATTGRTSLTNSVRDTTNTLAIELQDAIQDNLAAIVLNAIARNGLPVTIDLLDRLIDRSREGVTSLGVELAASVRKAGEVSSALANPPAGAPATFPVGSTDDVAQIVTQAESALEWYATVVAQEVARDFLKDMVGNLLEPWRRAVADADGLLRLEFRPRIGRSKLDIWPRDVGVPDYLRPSKVEYLLEDVEGFPAQFVSSIERSVNETKGSGAVITAVEQIIAGEELGKQANTRPVVLVDQVWIPTPERARRAGIGRAEAKINLTLSGEDVLARVHAWLIDQEKFIGQTLRQSLGDYLTDSLVPAPERQERQSRLVRLFQSMVSSSLPLINLDAALTNQIHGRDTPGYNLHVSPLNVPGHLTDLRLKIEETAAALLGSAQEVKFTETPRSDAMMMALLSEPYHMVEIASIMAPVAEQFARGSRMGDLWQYRRARPLTEWVPLGPSARRALVTGWFTARLMGTATATSKSGRVTLTVTVDGREHLIDHGAIRPAGRKDQVGMLLERLPAAMLECSNTASLEPLTPYRYLIALGGSIDDAENRTNDDATEFDTWLAKGNEQAAIAQIEDWVEVYQEIPAAIAKNDVADSQPHPMYELVNDITEALRRIKVAVQSEADGDRY